MSGKSTPAIIHNQEGQVIQVAIPPPGPSSALDYLLPPQFSLPPLGGRVIVWVAGRQRIGVVVGQDKQTYRGRLSRVKGVVDDGGAAIPADLLDLLCWTARYYHYPLPRVLLHALPKLLRQGHSVDEPQSYAWSVCATADATALARAPARKKLFEHLQQAPVNEEDLPAFSSHWRALMKALLDQGLVKRIVRQPTPPQVVPSPHRLSREQDQTLRSILARTDGFACHLIEGVTGSGKTEIYLRLAEVMLAEGRQSLILVPEIGLTSQLASDFRSRFGAACMVFHSAVSDKQRFKIWAMARKGTVGIVIGTRSAVFLPFARLGAIVVDEEHDLSYKQWEQLRYHARDIAVKRMQLLQRPVILGSATPSLESLHQAMTSRYHHHHLRQRLGSSSALEYEIVDLRRVRLQCGLSPRLLQLVHETVVNNGRQALLFINRRGYATRLVCRQCGAISMCPHCDSLIVYHLSDRSARCHHCHRIFAQAHHCAHCAGLVEPLGLGTERIEVLLNSLFPNTTVVRIDADSTRSKGMLEQRLDQARQGQPMLLVGTQMLSKGYHLPSLSLSGIVNLDHRLFSPDFRAVERVGQLIEQVSGRAGRGPYPGRVLLQTYQPDSPHINCLLQQGYGGFAQQILRERKAALLPPYSFLALFNAQAKQAGKAQRLLRKVAGCLGAAATAEDVAVFGPAPAIMEKRADFFRAQLLLRATQRSALHRCINKSMQCIRALPTEVRWSLDIDPMEIENLQEIK